HYAIEIPPQEEEQAIKIIETHFEKLLTAKDDAFAKAAGKLRDALANRHAGLRTKDFLRELKVSQAYWETADEPEVKLLMELLNSESTFASYLVGSLVFVRIDTTYPEQQWEHYW